MKRLIVSLLAVSGFLGVWLGLVPERDEIRFTAAQAEEQVTEETDCLPPQAISDMNQRRKSLELRESALQAKEQELVAREKSLEERLSQLESIRIRSATMDAKKKQEFEEKIARTVEVLEGMSPKSASQFIATSDDFLAVEAMARISPAKLSKIMNLLEPKRSVRLMELLVGSGTSTAGVDQGVPETNPKKEEKL